MLHYTGYSCAHLLRFLPIPSSSHFISKDPTNLFSLSCTAGNVLHSDSSPFFLFISSFKVVLDLLPFSFFNFFYPDSDILFYLCVCLFWIVLSIGILFNRKRYISHIALKPFLNNNLPTKPPVETYSKIRNRKN